MAPRGTATKTISAPATAAAGSWLEAVDDPELHRPLQIGQRAPAADDLAHRAGLPQGPRQGAADEADPDDGESLDHAGEHVRSGRR